MRTLVYYPVGSVHMRNLGLMAAALPDFRFRVFYRTHFPWFADTAAYPYESVVAKHDRPPASLFNGDVAGLVLSIAAVDRTVAELIEAARERGVPVMAIEEVIQIALNQGLINHYLMPLDLALLASDFEREAFEDLGIPPDRLRVTGWPFFSGLPGSAAARPGAETRDSLGIPPDCRIVTLFLSKLSTPKDPSSLETVDIRRRMLSLAAEGLPDGHHLVVKLHPTESSVWAKEHLAAFAPGATVVSGETDIARILDVTDVCLTRGNSQVVFEALLRDTPVLALPCGMQTVFDGFADEAIVHTVGQLSRALARLNEGRSIDYGAVLRRYCPVTPSEAVERTAAAIRDVASSAAATDAADRRFDLALFWGLLGDPDRGLALLNRHPATADAAAATRFLGELLRGAIGPSGLARLLHEYTKPYQQPAILALWSRQLHRSGATCTSSEWQHLVNGVVFPPHVNRHNYVDDAVRLGHVFLRSNDLEGARALVEVLLERFGDDDGVSVLAAKCNLAAGWSSSNALPYVTRRIRHTLRTSYRLSRRVLRGY